MKNATRRVDRAARRAIAKPDGLGTAGKPFVLTRDNVALFITATAGLIYRNPKSEKYRQAQKRRAK